MHNTPINDQSFVRLSHDVVILMEECVISAAVLGMIWIFLWELGWNDFKILKQDKMLFKMSF